MAVAALVLGIVSVVFCWVWWIGITTGIVALVLGIIKLIKLKKEEEPKGKGMTIAGVITGGIGFVNSIIIFLIAIIAIIAAGKAIRDTVDNSYNSISEINDSFFNTNTSSNTQLKDSYSFGEVVEVEEFKLTVKSVSDYVSTDEYSKPKEGNKFIKVEIEVENIGQEEKYVSSYDFDCYADNTTVSEAYVWASDDNTFYGKDLPAGKKTSGNIYYEIPKNTNVIEVHYSCYSSNDFFKKINVVFSNK